MPTLQPNILIIRRRYLGDLVLLGPLLRNLRRHWPKASLTVLAESAYGPVLALNPDVASILAFPAGAGGWVRFLRRLRAARYSHVLDLDNTEKTALLTWWTRAPFRTALRHKGRPRLPRGYTRVVRDPSDAHERRSIDEYYLQVLGAVGVPVVDREVRLVPRADDLAAVRSFVPASHPRLLVHPGSRSPYRLWPGANFAAVCDRLQAESGVRVVLAGGPREQDLLADIRRQCATPPAVTSQPLEIARFAALAAQFDAFLGHDSGPMHVAAAVGTPVIALFGSQNMALWRPHGSRHRLLQAPMPCRDCVAPGVCVPGDSYRSYCVRRLEVGTVLGAVRDVLGESAVANPRSSRTLA